MIVSKRWLELISVLVLGLIMVASGCTANRKPMPQTPAEPGPTAPLPAAPVEADRLADLLAGRAARVEGVSRAAVVVTQYTALVGLDLEGGRDRQQTEEIKRQVAREVKRQDNRIDRVYVATDPDTVTAIKRVSQGIGRGMPITTFSDEVDEIINKLKPVSG